VPINDKSALPVPIKIPLRISAVFLLLAIPPIWPYGYYTLLRLVVCVSSVYVAWQIREAKKPVQFCVITVIALLFNPIIPVHLEKEVWVVLDLVAAAILLILSKGK
jgi:hypothetical protein